MNGSAVRLTPADLLAFLPYAAFSESTRQLPALPLQGPASKIRQCLPQKYTSGIDSAAYATAASTSRSTTATVNNDLFGFVNTAADAVNNTTVQFCASIENSTFDGTTFAAPIIEFLVGSKVFALKSGLAWLKQNLNLRPPHVAPDVLTGNVSELASPYHVEGVRVLSERPQGEVYILSVFLGAYALIVLSVIVIMIEEECLSCASCGERDE